MKAETTGAKDEVTFDEVRVTDIIRIKTRNSVYEFLVIDPSKSYGMLVGGNFGRHAVEAFVCAPARLKVGHRVSLLVGAGRECRFVATSPVTALTHLTADSDTNFDSSNTGARVASSAGATTRMVGDGERERAYYAHEFDTTAPGRQPRTDCPMNRQKGVEDMITITMFSWGALNFALQLLPAVQ